ncbi:MAG: TRAP transporter large permease subunit [Thiobacillaceae bacterium]
MTSLVILGLFLLAFLGIPLFVILAAGSLILAASSDTDSAVLIVEMVRLGSSPTLLAIPLFTFAGVVLSHGGAPRRLVQVFTALVGRMPGGLAVVTLTSCAFFTAFSGASGVTILALGGLLHGMLLREAYPEKFSLGLVTSAGSIGLLLPPSLVILVYGVIAQVSIEKLFLAGLVPTLLLLVMLSLYSMRIGRATHARRTVYDSDQIKQALREGIWDVFLPVGIISGLLSGWLTVAEAATVTATYAVVLETLIHRTLHTRRHLIEVVRETAVLVGSILIILCAAMGLTNLLIDAQIPMHLLETLEQHIHSPLQFLLLLNVFLLMVGAMMDIFSAIVVVVPLLLPLAQRFGVDPIHLGILVLANLEIGYLTPPVGINLFLSCQRFKVPILKVFQSTLPFLLVMLLWLMLVTYVPMLSLWWQK